MLIYGIANYSLMSFGAVGLLQIWPAQCVLKPMVMTGDSPRLIVDFPPPWTFFVRHDDGTGHVALPGAMLGARGCPYIKRKSIENQCFSLQYLGCSCKFPLKKRWLNLIYGYWNGGKIWKYRENHEQLVDDEGLQGSPGQGEKIHLQFLIVSDCVYLNCSSKISPICKPHWMVN